MKHLWSFFLEGIAAIHELYRPFSRCHCGGERVEAGPACGYIVCRKCGEVE